MKVLNLIITTCFVVVFAGLFYLTTDSGPGTVDSPTIAVPPPPDKPPFTKSFPKMEEKKPYTEPAPPPPPKKEQIPVPTAMLQEDSLLKNEYVRGAVGAVIGWLVKGICEMLLGMIKKLSFIKNLGW